MVCEINCASFYGSGFFWQNPCLCCSVAVLQTSWLAEPCRLKLGIQIGAFGSFELRASSEVREWFLWSLSKSWGTSWKTTFLHLKKEEDRIFLYEQKVWKNVLVVRTEPTWLLLCTERIVPRIKSEVLTISKEKLNIVIFSPSLFIRLSYQFIATFFCKNTFLRPGIILQINS